MIRKSFSRGRERQVFPNRWRKPRANWNESVPGREEFGVSRCAAGTIDTVGRRFPITAFGLNVPVGRVCRTGMPRDN